MAAGSFWGDLVRNLREESGISQRSLAERAKVCRSTLRRIEAGEISADVDTLERILNVFGYELDAFSRTDGGRCHADSAYCYR